MKKRQGPPPIQVNLRLSPKLYARMVRTAKGMKSSRNAAMALGVQRLCELWDGRYIQPPEQP